MKYEYWFAKIQGINLRKKIRLRQCMKTAEAIYYIEETQIDNITDNFFCPSVISIPSSNHDKNSTIRREH